MTVMKDAPVISRSAYASIRHVSAPAAIENKCISSNMATSWEYGITRNRRDEEKRLRPDTLSFLTTKNELKQTLDSHHRFNIHLGG